MTHSAMEGSEYHHQCRRGDKKKPPEVDERERERDRERETEREKEGGGVTELSDVLPIRTERCRLEVRAFVRD